MPWPQTDIFLPPRPIQGLELDPQKIIRPDVKLECPYYHVVPKELSANLRFRREVIERAQGSKQYASDLKFICGQDILFYLNVFGFTCDPRMVDDGANPLIPWVTWGFQDLAILAINDAIGKEDLVIRKSRDMGATWNILACFHHRWKFKKLQLFTAISRNEDMVDKTGSPDSLFWKLDFLDDARWMPKFLRPEQDRSSMHKENLETGCVIDGESSTGNVGRGGRRTAMMLDEFASFPRGADVEVLGSTQANTNSRIFNSTPKGRGTAYYNMSVSKNVRHVFLHWTLHPKFSQGIRLAESGEPTSPWRELAAQRLGVSFLAQQELEMDDLASDYPFFDHRMLERIESERCSEPILTGDLSYDGESAEPSGFTEGNNSIMKLWRNLESGTHPQRDRSYVVSADIGLGISTDTTSNSTLCISDKTTREKIGEVATADMTPEAFAVLAVAVCKWFCDASFTPAFLIWEDNGPGGIFGKRVQGLNFGNFFYRGQEKDTKQKKTTLPGWWSTPETKNLLFGEYRRALSTGEFANPSRRAINECRNYQWKNGKVEYVGGGAGIDIDSTGESHGDLVIADALNWRVLRDFTVETTNAARKAVQGSLAHRREARKALELASRRDYY